MNNFYLVAIRISTKIFMGLNLIKFISNVTDKNKLAAKKGFLKKMDDE